MKTELGQLMRIYRAEFTMTQRQLGRKIGADHSRVSRIENGQLQPTPKQAARLVKLGILHPQETV